MKKRGKDSTITARGQKKRSIFKLLGYKRVEVMIHQDDMAALKQVQAIDQRLEAMEKWHEISADEQQRLLDTEKSKKR